MQYSKIHRIGELFKQEIGDVPVLRLGFADQPNGPGFVEGFVSDEQIVTGI